jgi:hypothetical protein
MAMVSWPELLVHCPDVAGPGLKLLYPHYAGVGLAFLSTIRPDGGPRLHPMCPIVNEHGLFAMIVPGPKRRDLLSDGRFAMHSFPTDDNEDAFYLTGRAAAVDDEALAELIVAQFLDERKTFGMTKADVADNLPFSFGIETAMLTRTTGHGDPHPNHLIWRAP